jgi:hypothetical protein
MIVKTDVPEGYVNKIDAARRLGLSTRQLERLVADGKLPKHRRELGWPKVFFKIADLDALREGPKPVESGTARNG